MISEFVSFKVWWMFHSNIGQARLKDNFGCATLGSADLEKFQQSSFISFWEVNHIPV